MWLLNPHSFKLELVSKSFSFDPSDDDNDEAYYSYPSFCSVPNKY